MNDKELAYKIVASGVGGSVKHTDDREPRYSIIDTVSDHHVPTSASDFVNDSRVAVALMGKTGNAEIYHCGDGWVVNVSVPHSNRYPTATNDSLPRAINEACVEALP